MVSRVHDIPGTHMVSVMLPAHAAATATEAIPIFRAPFACKVKAVRVIPGAAAVGDDTNSTHYNLLNGGSVGTGTTEIGNLDYVTNTNAAVGVVQDVYVPAAGSEQALSAGDILKMQIEKIGTGLALGTTLCVIEYQGN